MRRFRNVLAVLVAAALMLALAPMQPARGADEPFQLNFILALTGQAAFLGQSQKAALDVLEDVVNKQGGIKGRPVKFNYLDDQTNPQLSVQLANQLIAQHLSVIMGSDLSALCRATTPLYLAKGPVNFCLTPAIYPPKDGWVFSSNVSTKDIITAQIRYFHQRGWNRWARLTTTDASGQDADADIPETLAMPEFKDMTVVANEHMNPTDQSVAAQIARIKAANPQALLIWAPGTPFGTALRGMKDGGLDIPTAVTSANMVTKTLAVQYKGLIPSAGLYFQGLGCNAGMTENNNASMRAAINTYLAAIKEHGLSNDIQTAMAWDPAKIVVDAFRSLGTDATPEQIKDWIWNLKGYGGISGVYDFKDLDAHGLGVKDIVIMRWDPAKEGFVPVSKFGGYT
jgi:branched-chain amino acid transport system substrate-binding protein